MADTREIVATNLRAGKKNYFRVSAANEEGISDPCTTSAPISTQRMFVLFEKPV